MVPQGYQWYPWVSMVPRGINGTQGYSVIHDIHLSSGNHFTILCSRQDNIHPISLSNLNGINISSTRPIYAYRGTSATRFTIIIIIIFFNDLKAI